MRAVRSHKPEGFEGIESLVDEDAPDPQPAIGDALVRVRAASFTPTELTWPLRTEARSLTPKPATVDFTGAAAIPQAGLTSWQALFDRGHLEPGQTVVIHGAGSGVGAVGVQLARWAGAHVIGTGRASARQRALDFGADEFVDLEQDGWEKAAGQVDLVYDAIGGDVLARSPATRLVDEGTVRPQVGAVYPLAEAREAFMAKSAQHIPGKVVLTP